MKLYEVFLLTFHGERTRSERQNTRREWRGWLSCRSLFLVHRVSAAVDLKGRRE